MVILNVWPFKIAQLLRRIHNFKYGETIWQNELYDDDDTKKGEIIRENTFFVNKVCFGSFFLRNIGIND